MNRETVLCNYIRNCCSDKLIEVGLGFTADYSKKGGFIGKEATMKQKEEWKEKGGLSRKLLQVGALYLYNMNQVMD